MCTENFVILGQVVCSPELCLPYECVADVLIDKLLLWLRLAALHLTI